MERKGVHPLTIIKELLSVGGLRIERALQAVQKIQEGLLELNDELGTDKTDIVKRDLSVLTKRQREIFELMGQKVPLGTIAKQLRLSMRTVEAHRNTMRLRLKLSNAKELTKFAVSQTKE